MIHPFHSIPFLRFAFYLSSFFPFSPLCFFLYSPVCLPQLFLAVGVERWKTGDCNYDLFFRVSKVMMASLTNL